MTKISVRSFTSLTLTDSFRTVPLCQLPKDRSPRSLKGQLLCGLARSRGKVSCIAVIRQCLLETFTPCGLRSARRCVYWQSSTVGLLVKWSLLRRDLRHPVLPSLHNTARGQGANFFSPKNDDSMSSRQFFALHQRLVVARWSPLLGI